jgi:hypothetical protein
MYLVTIEHGLAHLQATPQDCRLLAAACDAAAEHVVDAARESQHELLQLAASFFHAASLAATYQNHLPRSSLSVVDIMLAD